jgi:hypothetical protein
MQTLVFSSKQYKEVADITRPYVKGNVIDKGLPDDDSPSHWGTPTFNSISRITAGYCLDAMNSMQDGEILLYCDSDVLLLEDTQWFADQIGDNDFVIQSDKGTYCMGFFVVKVSDKTKKVIRDTIEAMKDNSKNYQEVFNVVAKDLKIELFKESDVWNYGVIGNMWTGQDFEIPKGLKAFHANYTVGIPNKVILLNRVIKEYENTTNN